MLPLAIAALWGFAEATLFFIVADVPIMAVGFRYGTKRALLAALVAAVGAALGGLVVMHWAAIDPAGSRATIESLPGIGPALFDGAAVAWREGGVWEMLKGSFRGEPYKLYAHAAGVSGAGMAGFFLASFAARLPRFIMIAVVSGLAGPRLRTWIPKRLFWPAFVLCWTGFYAVYLLTV